MFSNEAGLSPGMSEKAEIVDLSLESDGGDSLLIYLLVDEGDMAQGNRKAARALTYLLKLRASRKLESGEGLSPYE
jgi:hypothetical protein